MWRPPKRNWCCRVPVQNTCGCVGSSWNCSKESCSTNGIMGCGRICCWWYQAHSKTRWFSCSMTRTMEKIKLRAYWYGMSTDVRLYVATSRQCTVNKRSQRTMRAPLQNYQAGNRGDRVHLDMLGAFRESHQGNKYVLMIIDQFTRWLEIVPLPMQDAESVAKAFFEYYIVPFGVPWCVHRDQGRNFDSKLFKIFCELLDAVKTRTTPYRPCSNGQVERNNQLVLNFLRKEWDTHLPPLGMSVRSIVNRNTGFTPNLL